MLASGFYGFFIYVTIPVMLVVVLGRSQTDPLTVFLAYTEAIFGSAGPVKWLIGIPLIVALLLSVLNAIMGCGRSLYQIAHDGLLPRAFQRQNRHGVPAAAMGFNLVASIAVVFFGSPLEIYIFSNMGYLLSLALALIGYFLSRQFQPDTPRPVRLPGALRHVALFLGVAFCSSGCVAVLRLGYCRRAGKRWLFFLGLGVIVLYVPLYGYRRLIEDRKPVPVVEPIGEIDT